MVAVEVTVAFIVKGFVTEPVAGTTSCVGTSGPGPGRFRGTGYLGELDVDRVRDAVTDGEADPYEVSLEEQVAARRCIE